MDLYDVEDLCDLHDLLFDIIIEHGAEPGCGSSSHNKFEFSFTQFANQPDKTEDIVQSIYEKIDVYLKQVFVSPPVNAYHWKGWDLNDPFDMLEDLSYLVPKS